MAGAGACVRRIGEGPTRAAGSRTQKPGPTAGAGPPTLGNAHMQSVAEVSLVGGAEHRSASSCQDGRKARSAETRVTGVPSGEPGQARGCDRAQLRQPSAQP
jgi:hypothetical protein